MEAMAPDEMDQHHRQKSGREELEDTVQDQIRAKEHEISTLSEEIIEKEEEIKEMREEMRGVEKEIAIASGTEVRKEFEAKVQFLRQQIIIIRQQIILIRQQISNCDQQIVILQQEINSVRTVQKTPTSAAFEQIVYKLDFIYGLLQESFSRTRAASTINADDLGALRDCLGVRVLPEEEEGGVTLEALLGSETGGGDSFWDEDTCELQRKDEFFQQFRNMTRTCRDVIWKDARERKLKRTFTDAPFHVVAKNGLVLSLRRFQSFIGLGAILGVEITRKLCWRGLRQAEVEFYVWSTESQYPFIQLITDMERGGVAIYSTGGSDVRLRTLGSMEALWDFVGGLVKSLPPGAGNNDSEGGVIHPDMFPAPSRKRFRSRDLGMGSMGPQAGSSSVGQQMTFWRMIAAYNNNLGDVANLRDLDCFDLEAVH